MSSADGVAVSTSISRIGGSTPCGVVCMETSLGTFRCSPGTIIPGWRPLGVLAGPVAVPVRACTRGGLRPATRMPSPGACTGSVAELSFRRLVGSVSLCVVLPCFAVLVPGSWWFWLPRCVRPSACPPCVPARGGALVWPGWGAPSDTAYLAAPPPSLFFCDSQNQPSCTNSGLGMKCVVP